MRRVPWTRQPPYPVGIDWSNPLTRGLVAHVTNRSSNAGHVALNSGASFSLNKTGVLVSPNSTGYASVNSPLVSPPFSVAFTLFFVYSGLSTQALVGQGGATSSGKGWYVSSGAGFNDIRITFGGVADYIITGGILSSGTTYRVLVVVSGGLAVCYLNGVNKGSIAVGSMLTPASKPLTIGAYHTGSAYGGFPVSSIGDVVLWSRALSANDAKMDAANPHQIFEPYTVFDNIPFPIVTAQFARPTSDASTGTWTASSGTLASCLDETTASDADYITTTNTSTCEVALGSVTDPSVSTGHIVRYRISATSGGITVRLRQGTTTIATWTHATAPTSLTTYSQTLTGGEADSITDYTALRLQFEAT